MSFPCHMPRRLVTFIFQGFWDRWIFPAVVWSVAGEIRVVAARKLLLQGVHCTPVDNMVPFDNGEATPRQQSTVCSIILGFHSRTLRRPGISTKLM